MKLDSQGQFVTLDGRATGVYAAQNKRGRWQYRNSAGDMMGSGMSPDAFVRGFWLRDDFVEKAA